jgi:hypothetical protein
MSLARGQFHINTDNGSVLISYREHDTGNGILLVDLDGNPLTAEHLLDIAEQIASQQESLERSRGGNKKATSPSPSPSPIGKPSAVSKPRKLVNSDLDELDKD